MKTKRINPRPLFRWSQYQINAYKLTSAGSGRKPNARRIRRRLYWLGQMEKLNRD